VGFWTGKGCPRYSGLIRRGCTLQSLAVFGCYLEGIWRSVISELLVYSCHSLPFPASSRLASFSTPASPSLPSCSCSPLPRWSQHININRRWTTRPSQGPGGPATNPTSYKVMHRPLVWLTMSLGWLTTRLSDAYAGDSIFVCCQFWQSCVSRQEQLCTRPLGKVFRVPSRIQSNQRQICSTLWTRAIWVMQRRTI
jgi:hypothetical protein